MYKLQDVLLKPIIGNKDIKEMYYRISNDSSIAKMQDGVIRIKKNTFIETFTYFGSLSSEKWKRYTFANRFFLVLNISGKFEVTLFGHYIENKKIEKEFLGRYYYECEELTELVIPYPDSFKSQIIAFSIESESKLKVGDAYYSADLESDIHNNPYISLNTTTFKKEEYIKRNIELLRSQLFDCHEFKDKFTWHIVDNGNTLDVGEFDNISIIHNKNTGGAGGFARGMIDSLRQEKKPSHVLLMDDDVNVSPESFKRLYRLLDLLRPEYKDYFVSGAMLNMDAPNIQHESTGTLEDGYCRPLNSGRNLALWDQILFNEQIDDKTEYRYAAWWFCCIPTTIASLDNLPLPVFVRGDDMEYSIRNHAKFITMNGISIWHMNFGGKYNAAMECYQAKRNELIVFSTRPELSSISSFDKIEEYFWQSMYKFDYVSASFYADAVEDYLKGPEWFSEVDLFNEINKRRKEDYKKEIITEKVNRMVNYDTLYINKKVPRLKKLIYDYTYNGQARIPEFFCKGIGIIPYNGAYYPEKQLLTKENYAIDPINGLYIILKKDRRRFNSLKKRWMTVKKQYITNKEDLTKRYTEYEQYITNDKFWNKYLEDSSK